MNFATLEEATAANRFKLEEVSADKVYLSGENFLTTLRLGAIPYIPFKSNSNVQTNSGSKSTVWTKMFHFYMQHREEFLVHYHKRSKGENYLPYDKGKVRTAPSK
jgi:transposase